MTPDRPLQLLRFALESRDVPLATALARALGARADACLRNMPRIVGPSEERRLLRAALELVAAPAVSVTASTWRWRQERRPSSD